MNQKLKVGVVLDGIVVPAWVFHMFKKIQASNYAEVSILINNGIAQPKTQIPVLWKIYGLIDKKLFKVNPDAFDEKSLKDLFSDEAISIHLGDEKSLKILKDQHLDVIIDVSKGTLPKNLFNFSSFGIWAFHQKDNGTVVGEAASYEVANGLHSTQVNLIALSTDHNSAQILQQSFSSTRRESVYRNRNSYYWKAAELLPRKLKELHKNGQNALENTQRGETKSPKASEKPLLSNGGFLRSLPKIFRYWIGERKKFKKFNEQWNLLYCFGNENMVAIKGSNFSNLKSPDDRLWADPFVIHKNDKYYIFIEELVYKEKLGKISVMELDKAGNFTTPQTILRKDYHLSYPFLIEDNGALYMVPETKGNRTIELYKCVDFPLQWQFEQILIDDIEAVDSTIYKHNDQYWLFCNVTENKGISSHDELFLFYSKSLLNSEWKSHPCNPIISDVRSSRPAGNIFYEDGKLWRPSQDSAKQYGYGLTFNEIIELTETSYEEKAHKSLYPEWDDDLHATHTVNRHKELTVIDGLKYLKKN